MVEVNSETDFVSRNDQFQSLVKDVANAALGTDGDVEAVLAAPASGGKPVKDVVTEAVATIGENLNLRRSAALAVEAGVVASYVHASVSPGLGKIGVIVGVESTGDAAKVAALGRQIAMHIAAASPLAVDADGIDAETVRRERAIFAEQARESGKPEGIIDKMVEGRMRKFFEESVLLKQAFVMDTERTVEAVLKDSEKDVGAPVTVSDFVVFRLGEGIDKGGDD